MEEVARLVRDAELGTILYVEGHDFHDIFQPLDADNWRGTHAARRRPEIRMTDDSWRDFPA